MEILQLLHKILNLIEGHIVSDIIPNGVFLPQILNIQNSAVIESSLKAYLTIKLTDLLFDRISPM